MAGFTTSFSRARREEAEGVLIGVEEEDVRAISHGGGLTGRDTDLGPSWCGEMVCKMKVGTWGRQPSTKSVVLCLWYEIV